MTTSARTLAHLSRTIVLVGAGKMGGALLEGWLALGLDPKYAAVLEPQPSRELTGLAGRGLRLNPTPGAIGEVSAIIVAVKPQMASEVMPALAAYVGAGTVVVSIMAGPTLGFLEQALSQRSALVRAMPNTPAAIGRGITVAVPNVRVSGRQRELVHAPLDPAALRRNVPARGGTTAAALAILGGPQGLRELMIRAVGAATERSRQLAG